MLDDLKYIHQKDTQDILGLIERPWRDSDTENILLPLAASQLPADHIQQATAHIAGSLQEWLPEVSSANNPAKQLAKELAGKTAVIYAGPQLAVAAECWKQAINRHARNLAWWGRYPEAAEHDALGWTSHPINKPYEVIDLRSSYEDEQTSHYFTQADKKLSGRRPKAHSLQAAGQTETEQLLWAIVFGQYVACYLGLVNGVNPTPQEILS